MAHDGVSSFSGGVSCYVLLSQAPLRVVDLTGGTRAHNRRAENAENVWAVLGMIMLFRSVVFEM